MAKKIKIVVESVEQNVTIPAIPLSAAAAILKVVLWGSQYVPAQSRDETVQILLDNREAILQFVQTSVKELKECEPFRLVEVESGPTRVLIDILG